MIAQIICTLIGIWLTAAPQIFRYDGIAADHDHIVGPIVASLACIAIWQVTRALRWINVVIGAWLLLAPWILGYPWNAAINSMIVGLLLVALSLVKGRQRRQYGGGWKMLFAKVRSNA